MFEQLSERARRVVFLTRRNAGRRGGPVLETNDLLEALVREDQGELAKPPFPGAPVMSNLSPRNPFFSAHFASQILLSLERVSTNAEAIPESQDMEVSPTLLDTFHEALALSKDLGQKHVEPLHLLAALVPEKPHEASQVLKEVGLTREAVVAAIRTGEFP